MSVLLLARILPAVALLPVGGLGVRLVLGGTAALFLAPHVPVSTDFSVQFLAGEVAVGALLGLLASLPAHAAAGLRADGPEALAFAGQTLSWAVFFAVGGPVLWLLALGQSFRALPVGPWPEAALLEGGRGLFGAALLLGLPAWLTALVLGPLAGLVDRLGTRHGSALLALRPLVALVLLAALLPLFLDVLRSLWLEAFHG